LVFGAGAFGSRLCVIEALSNFLRQVSGDVEEREEHVSVVV
jgi:hypothetical protein